MKEKECTCPILRALEKKGLRWNPETEEIEYTKRWRAKRGENYISRIIANHVAAKQVASGRTKDSIKVELTENGGILWGRFPFGTLETGRRAGRTPHNFTGIIRQWIIDKGISVPPIQYIREPSERWKPKYTPKERGLMSMAGAIAHKIKTEGTKLYREGGRNDIYSPEVEKTVNSITDRVGLLFEQEVEHINLNTKNEDGHNK